jgi:hypothetical protein
MSSRQPDDDAIIEQLARGPLHRFSDWPNPDVPNVAIGLYTVWREEEFLYVGMAGRADVENLRKRTGSSAKSGLRSRLGSHAAGRRGGDQFCVYVADKLLAAAGHTVSDDLVRDYVCRNLSYRFFAFPELSIDHQKTAYRLEKRIRGGKTALGTPVLNARRASK